MWTGVEVVDQCVAFVSSSLQALALSDILFLSLSLLPRLLRVRPGP